MNVINHLVSIVMPAYNGEKSLSRAINSLIDQTYQNWECIIINDGSTDNTLEVIKESCLRDARIKYVSFNQNKGRAKARQVGLEMAQGDYLAMLDCDDFYHPQKIKYQLEIMDKYPDIVLVSSGMYSFGEKFTFIVKRGSGNNEVFFYDGVTPLKGVTHAPSLIKMSVAKACQYDLDLAYGEDIDFLEKCLYRQNYLSSNSNLYYYSEFDSITFSKIRKGYLDLVHKYFKNRDVKHFSIFILKYLISLIYLPLKGLKSIIEGRGQRCSVLEYNEFIKLKKRYEE